LFPLVEGDVERDDEFELAFEEDGDEAELNDCCSGLNIEAKPFGNCCCWVDMLLESMNWVKAEATDTGADEGDVGVFKNEGLFKK